MRFEVEIIRNAEGQWAATAVEHGVTATGVTEKEAIGRLLEALTAHFKKEAGKGGRP